MGIDARVYVKDGDLTPEMEAKIVEYDFQLTLDGEVFVYRNENEYGSWLSCSTMSRLFTFNYPRGYWPYIKSDILMMRDVFKRPVYYHGDYWLCGEVETKPISDEDIQELDAFWAEWEQDDA
jgi:hypothetical protein